MITRACISCKSVFMWMNRDVMDIPDPYTCTDCETLEKQLEEVDRERHAFGEQADSLRVQNERLRAENARLDDAVNDARAQIDKLHAECDAMRDVVAIARDIAAWEEEDRIKNSDLYECGITEMSEAIAALDKVPT